MYCVGRLRTPYPYVLGRPLPCIGCASSVAIKPPMAVIDKLCEPFLDISPSSPSHHAPTFDLSDMLRMESMYKKISSEKQLLVEKLLALGSELGVGTGDDSTRLVDEITSFIRHSEHRRREAEQRATACNQKHLDAAMHVQVLELELAEARKQRDAALLQLQDLTCQSALTSPPNNFLARVTCSVEDISQTPSLTPALDTRVVASYLSAPYVSHTTPDTAARESVAVPIGQSHPSPAVSGLVQVVFPPSRSVSRQPTPARSPVVRHTPVLFSSVASVSRAVVTTVNSSRAAAQVQPPPAFSYIWKMDDLKSFHPGGGDIILGSGVSASVHLYRHRVTGTPVAIKIFKLPDDINRAIRKMKSIKREAQLLDTIGRRELFPSFMGCLETSPGFIGLAMEFVGDVKTGEAWTLFRGLRELVLSRKEWLLLALDIARSLLCLHNMGLLYNDLKEDNCLLRKTETGRWEAVIIDFGLVFPKTTPFFCCLSDEDKEKYRRREVYVHIAPECALYDQGTTIKSDVFQLGRVLRLIGVAVNNDDITFIGDLCTENTSPNRPTVEEIIDQLEFLERLA